MHKLRTKYEFDDSLYTGSAKKLPFFVICCNLNNTTTSAPYPFSINGYINLLYKDMWYHKFVVFFLHYEIYNSYTKSKFKSRSNLNSVI